MSVNSYFQKGNTPGNKPEQDLAEDLIVEMIKMAGYNCFYIPRTAFNPDDFYHEDPNARFNSSHEIEMYLQNVSDYGGQGDIMTKFGLQVNDTAELVVSRRRFYEETGIENPSEGDLIYIPLSKHLLNIDFVEDEPGSISGLNQFYTLGKLYCFVFKCSLHEVSQEDYDTGIEIIDTELADSEVNESYITNDKINEEGLEVLSWDEQNPFGETTEE